MTTTCRRLVAVLIVLLLTLSLAPMAPAGADQCAPPGEQGRQCPAHQSRPPRPKAPPKTSTRRPTPSRWARSTRLPSADHAGHTDRRPRCRTHRRASASTPRDSSPGSTTNCCARVADKLGLKINFVGTDFSGLLAQVASRRFDVGSSSITTTDARRQTVGFTNGYDFGYFSLVVPPGSPIKGFGDLAKGQRIGVVQGTVQEAYVVDTLHLDPVKFPDYKHALRQPQDSPDRRMVAPSQQAVGTVQPGDPAVIVENTFSLDNFRGVGRREGEQAADRRAQRRTRRRHRRRDVVQALQRLGAACAAAGLEAGIQGRAGFRCCPTSPRSPPARSGPTTPVWRGSQR